MENKIHNEKTLPLDDYPRPQLQRPTWQNLNGWWQYAITEMAQEPTQYDGLILVPYSPETKASGVQRPVSPTQTLWYKRTVTVPAVEAGAHVLLHFGAVDQFCRVFVDRQLRVTHRGGYWPFTVEITGGAAPRDVELIVAVQDHSDQGLEAYGKQKLAHGGMWYTPQSGIWQTVWLEVVPATYLTDLTITPDVAAGAVTVALTTNRPASALTVQVLADGEPVAGAPIDPASGYVTVSLPRPHLWTPADPFLYDVVITADDDQAQSYFGLRSFARGLDAAGRPAFLLNGQPFFQSGLLDQGYWAAGLYTPPSDAAVVRELTAIKEMGFNMLRKHIKIEPLRWYYHCDRLGILVWQDFVSGGGPYNDWLIRILPFVGAHFSDQDPALLGRGEARSRAVYLRDAQRTLDLLKNTVSICTWVPFNEGWGQFSANEIAAEVAWRDPTRLVDQASGWYDQGGGDFRSHHSYYKPFRLVKNAGARIQALTEFGGYALAVPNHIQVDRAFGYKSLADPAALLSALTKLYHSHVRANIPRGLAVAIYTQVSDVEDEINGLWTFDRAVCKIDPAALAALNADLQTTFEAAQSGV